MLHVRCIYTAANELVNNIIMMLLQVHDFNQKKKSTEKSMIS